VLPQHLFAPAPSPKFGEACKDSDVAELTSLLKANEGSIAAVIMEPIVQGAGGMHFYSAEYLERVRALCDAHDTLLILDCVATGFGRTGELFACQHAGISPDIMCVGKALTGGYMTLGATIATQEVADGVSGGGKFGGGGEADRWNARVTGELSPVPLMHGPTFMGNPLACAVACASIDLLHATPWQERVSAISEQLKVELAPARSSPAVHDVRVLGAIGVIEMEKPLNAAPTQELLASHGVWLRPFGKLLYTMPPFIASERDLTRIGASMRAVVESVEQAVHTTQA
jgi:adenosylmethionine---8-amino-7-oxononanoate aminotransferase